MIKLLSNVLLLLLTSACSLPQGHKVILNQKEFPQHEKADEFKNIYDPVWSETKYDQIKFLTKDEWAPRTYFRNHGEGLPGSQGIDRTKGMNIKNFTTPIDWAKVHAKEGKVRITWIGHASFLISIGETHFLTDPSLTDLPFAWLLDSLKRHIPPAANEKELSFVSAVVISHNHYDHLDFESIHNLGNKINYFVPLRTEKNFSKTFTNVTGMDWYTKTSLQGVNVTFVPVQHWTQRTPWDRNQELWGGWILEKDGLKIFFPGDTGYSKIFKDIKERFGKMDICLMPIIAYRPYRYRAHHISPEMAIDAANDLECGLFIPWGQGTWTLGHENFNENLRRLEAAKNDMKPKYPINVMKIGETLIIK